MLIKDIKSEYEKHRIFQYNEKQTKVLKKNVELKYVYGNIYVGKPNMVHHNEKYDVYLYFKEYDVGVCVYSVDNKTSVVSLVSMVDRMQMSSVQEFMKYVDSCVLTFAGDVRLYRAIVKAINPEREKLYRKMIALKEQIDKTQNAEKEIVKAENMKVVGKSSEIVKDTIEKLKNGGRIENEIICRNNASAYFETVVGFLAGWYFPFLTHNIRNAINECLEFVVIKDNKVIEIKASKKKREMIKAIETIISLIQDNEAEIEWYRDGFVLKSSKAGENI